MRKNTIEDVQKNNFFILNIFTRINSFEDLIVFIFMGVFVFDKLLMSIMYRIIGVCLIIYYIFKIISRKKIIINAGLKWQLFFVFFSFFSLLYADTFMQGHVYTVLTTFGFIFILSQYFSSKEKLRNNLEKMLSYISFWGALFIVYILGTQWHNFQYGGRLGSTILSEEFGNATTFSYYTIIITIALIWNCFSSNKYMLINWMLVGMSLFTSMMTGGRKAVLLPLIFFAVYVIFLYKKNIKKLFKYSIIMLLVSVGLIYLSFTVPLIYNIFGFRVEALFSTLIHIETSVDATTVSSDLYRQDLILDGFKAFLKRPLLGYGLAMSREVYDSIGLGYTHAHNNYIDLLISGGMIMFISWYWIYPYLLVRLCQTNKYDKSGLSSFFIAFIIVNLFSDWGSTTFNILHFNLFIILASVSVQIQNGSKCSNYNDSPNQKD